MSNEVAEWPDSRRIQLAEVNEAAVRLRRSLKFGPNDPWPDLDAALATERRATVERIRAAYRDATISPHGTVVIPDLDAILDAEAE